MSKRNLTYREYRNWEQKTIIEGVFTDGDYQIGKAIAVPETMELTARTRNVLKKLIEVAVAKRLEADGRS